MLSKQHFCGILFLSLKKEGIHTEEILKVLEASALFSGFPQDILQQIISYRQLQEYRKGQFLVSPQQELSRFGILLSGKIHIMHIFQEGSYSLMSVLTAGDMLGADLICTRTRRSPYHAMTAAPVRMLYFPSSMLTEPGFFPERWRLLALSNLATWISNENIKKEYRLAILSQKGLRERILTYLTMQASRKQKTAFTIPFSREELAAFLCVNRSALSHELSLMQYEGLITFRKNYFSLNFLQTPGKYAFSEDLQEFPF